MMQKILFLVAALLLATQTTDAAMPLGASATTERKAIKKHKPTLFQLLKAKAARFFVKRSLHQMQKTKPEKTSSRLGLITGPLSLGLLIASLAVLILTGGGDSGIIVGVLLVASFIAAVITPFALPGKRKGIKLSEKARTAKTLGLITLLLFLLAGLIGLIIASISIEFV